jgi:membrane protein implicated in regulation of membrane protease activity
MQIMEFIGNAGPWAWIVGGLILLALELALPGGFLLWMGISGLVTGLVVLVQPIGWPLHWRIFGVLSLVSIALWVRWSRSRPAPADRPQLNERASRHIGREVVLEQAIAQGFGRVVLGDSLWRVSGADLPAGQLVRIVGHQGAVLKVEPVDPA